MPKKEEKKVTKQEKKNKNENKSWFKSLKVELKKVTWPTPKELLNKTVAVIVFVLIIALIVFVFDLIAENAYNLGTGAVKSLITSEESPEEVTEEATENVEETTDALVEDTTTEVVFETTASEDTAQ